MLVLFLRVKQWGKSPLQFLLKIKNKRYPVVQDVQRCKERKEKRKKTEKEKKEKNYEQKI
jgi:hypothetical protein